MDICSYSYLFTLGSLWRCQFCISLLMFSEVRLIPRLSLYGPHIVYGVVVEWVVGYGGGVCVWEFFVFLCLFDLFLPNYVDITLYCWVYLLWCYLCCYCLEQSHHLLSQGCRSWGSESITKCINPLSHLGTAKISVQYINTDMVINSVFRTFN